MLNGRLALHEVDDVEAVLWAAFNRSPCASSLEDGDSEAARDIAALGLSPYG
jgi:hypothetical protein